ncbi:MAG: hypothetical protein KJZ65_04295 [Phycisphaerales bacterium]|nr:hypothetical protein [Phycisphaerales bacterium]
MCSPAIWWWLISLAACGLVGARPQQAAPPTAPPANSSLNDRLESLHPSDPQAYFLLGEELAAEPQTPGNLELAQRLYVLAIVLASKDESLRTIAAGSALALLDITRSEADRRALRSISSALDARFGTRDWSRSTEASVSDDVAYAAATTVGAIRAGMGALVRNELKRPEIRSLIDRFSALITGSPGQNILPTLERAAEAWPCPECRNERIVTKRHTGQVERVLCYTCGGNPGPTLTREQFIGQLRFEAQVLNSTPRSWGAQVAADLGAPLREADIAELPIRFGIDVTLAWYRGGAWVADPGQGDFGGEDALSPDPADPSP